MGPSCIERGWGVNGVCRGCTADAESAAATALEGAGNLAGEAAVCAAEGVHCVQLHSKAHLDTLAPTLLQCKYQVCYFIQVQ